MSNSRDEENRETNAGPDKFTPSATKSRRCIPGLSKGSLAIQAVARRPHQL